MAVLDAHYPDLDSYDLHLVPGMESPRLDQRLLLTVDTSTDPLRADKRNKSATDLEFSARLAGQPADFPARHGISLDTGTGALRMTQATLVPGLRSFTVNANVRDHASGTGVANVRMRVHVHPGIADLWLAPNILTLRKGARDVRLSLFARFTDGVVGDVTNWGARLPVVGDDRTFAHVPDKPDPWLTWSAGDNSDVAVDARTGVLTTTSERGGGPITATVGAPGQPTRTALASVGCREGWDTFVPLKPLGGADFAKVGERTNVLILPDGFEETERLLFEQAAIDLVGRLQSGDRTRPFDLVKDHVNYFTAWVKSRQPGVSVLNQIRHHTPVTAKEGADVPPSSIAVLDPVTVSELIDRVGLPAPALDVAGSPLGPRAGDWQARFGIAIDLPDEAARRKIHDEWLALRDRTLVDDVDTAFHTAFGSRPSAEGEAPTHSLDLNPRRLSGADFDTFLDHLYDEKADPGHQRPFTRWSAGGPDQRHVVIICRSSRLGGANSPRGTTRANTAPRLIATSLGDRDTHRLTDVAPRVTVHADDVPVVIPDRPGLAIAHELAHSWTVLDEYAGSLRLGNDPRLVPQVNAAGNVQTRASLLPSPSSPTIDANRIKWLWPRVAGCGVLRRPPRPDGSRWVLELGRGHVRGNHPKARDKAPPGQPNFRAFNDGDIVRLRTRPLLGSTMSDQVRVVTADPITDSLVVAAIPPRALPDLSGFGVAPGSESIVIRPPRLPDPDLAHGNLGAELSLVSPRALAWLRDDPRNPHHHPLNAAVGAGPDREWGTGITDHEAPTPAPAFEPPALRPKGPRFTTSIVGLFEEGAAVNRDVYRPSGICLMRSVKFARDDHNSERKYLFCPVCRYVIVDLLEPAQHGAIDRDYDKRYLR